MSPTEKKAGSALSLSVQYADPRLKETLTRAKLRRWVQAALRCPAILTIRFVDETESRALNHHYRGKNKATNVLTFQYNAPHNPASTEKDMAQADIILCTDILQQEAAEQNKSLEAHAAHLVIHGVLHAQCYDHETDEDAEKMEVLETKILAKLGFTDPYQTQ